MNVEAAFACLIGYGRGPLAYLLPPVLGAEGVFWAEGISDFISVANAGIVYFILRKRIMESYEKNRGFVTADAA